MYNYDKNPYGQYVMKHQEHTRIESSVGKFLPIAKINIKNVYVNQPDGCFFELSVVDIDFRTEATWRITVHKQNKSINVLLGNNNDTLRRGHLQFSVTKNDALLSHEITVYLKISKTPQNLSTSLKNVSGYNSSVELIELKSENLVSAIPTSLDIYTLNYPNDYTEANVISNLKARFHTDGRVNLTGYAVLTGVTTDNVVIQTTNYIPVADLTFDVVVNDTTNNTWYTGVCSFVVSTKKITLIKSGVTNFGSGVNLNVYFNEWYYTSYMPS